jgi:hypothetical protein
VLSGFGAYLSVRFLVRYFQTRTLTPFGIYCLIAGLGSIALPRTDQVTGPGRPNVARMPPHMTHGPEGELRPRNFGRRLPFNM